MLTGIHFILTYTCNFECDHCFLYCSPKACGTFTLAQVAEVLDELEKTGTISSVGFEGGEPFLFHPLLAESIRLATRKGFHTSVQTNNYWAATVEDAKLWLRPLVAAGLGALDVSADTFHHDEEMAATVKNAMAAAEALRLNVSTICIQPPRVGPSEGQEKGDPIYQGGPKLRGRAADKLARDLPVQSWKGFDACPFEDLKNPRRVHIDALGNVHLCQGISMGNFLETPLSQILTSYDPMSHPIAGPLIEGGPAHLARVHQVEMAPAYVDACHCCTHICKSLMDRFPEQITPAQVYGK